MDVNKTTGTAYATSYYKVYAMYQYTSNDAKVQAIVQYEKEMASEPVGTPQWHGLVGGLTALSVLLPHGAMNVAVK